MIKSRLEVYLSFVEKTKEIELEPKAIDLGCGRGEWLELLNENGFITQGVDLDSGMLEACTKRGFDVQQMDAIAALKSLNDNSYSIVSGFHIVEHLPFEVLQSLVQESLRVLKPGGMLIMETPNPENIKVATANFYLDPTHIRPIPPQLLSFLPEHYGFERTKILRLHENRALHFTDTATLSDVINGASPDYAVIAQKSAASEILQSFKELFAKDFGLSLDSLMTKFDNRFLQIERNVNEANTMATAAEARAIQAEQSANEANARAIQAEHNANEAWHHYAMVVNSNSWKLTYPLRLLGKFARWFVYGSYHWLTFSPTSRPRRVIKNLALKMKNYIVVHPKLKMKIVSILNRFPSLKARLKRIGSPSAIQNSKFTIQNLELTHLSPLSKQIYLQLKDAIEQKQKAPK